MPRAARGTPARGGGRGAAAAHHPHQLRERGSGRCDSLARRRARRERGAHRRAQPAHHVPDARAGARPAGGSGARGHPREPGLDPGADRPRGAGVAGGEAPDHRSRAGRQGALHTAAARTRDADRPARVHACRRSRGAPEGGGEQGGTHRGRAALQCGARHGPRCERRALSRPAAPARRKDRRRVRPAHLRVSAQACQRRGARDHTRAGVRRHRVCGPGAAARAGARGTQPVERAGGVPPPRARVPAAADARRRAPASRGGAGRCAGERPGHGLGRRPRRRNDHRPGPSDELARDPNRAAQLLGAPGNDRAARCPAAPGAARGPHRGSHVGPRPRLRHQLAAVHAKGRLGGLDARDHRRRRTTAVRRQRARRPPGTRRPGDQPREHGRAGDPPGARVAHQRARALDTARPRPEQRAGPDSGRQRGAVHLGDAHQLERGRESGGPVPERRHPAHGDPHGEPRRLRDLPPPAGSERPLGADDRSGAERARDHHARG